MACLGKLKGAIDHLIKLLGMDPVRSLHPTVRFGERSGNTNSLIPRCWHSSSKTDSNSEPPVHLYCLHWNGPNWDDDESLPTTTELRILGFAESISSYGTKGYIYEIAV